MSNVFSASALIGGTAGCVDKINGDDLADKDICVVAIPGLELMAYVLDEDSAEAENSPYIISPDLNAGDKRWKLLGFKGNFSHVDVKTTAGQSIPNNTATEIIFGTENQDTLNEFNISNGRFTALYDGNYLVNCLLLSAYVAWTANEYFGCQIRINGVNHADGQQQRAQSSVSYIATTSISKKVELSAGEYISIFCIHDQGGAVSLNTAGSYNWLTIDRIA